MPQFDTFSFFSQLFWAFVGFLFFYLIISLYLLPALAVILKIRKRKLSQSAVSNSVQYPAILSIEVLKISVSTVNLSVNILSDLNNKFSDIKNSNDSHFKPILSSVFLKNFGFKNFWIKTLNQTQIAVLMFN